MKCVPKLLPSLLIPMFALSLRAQQAAVQQAPPAFSQSDRDAAARAAEIRELRQQLDALSARLRVLEAQATAAIPEPQAATASSKTPAALAANPAAPPAASSSSTAAAGSSTVAAATQPAAAPNADAAQDSATLGFFRGTTLNFGLDGYYAYNFNKPIGRANQLRAYDLSSNSFSINQASIVVEHLPVAEPGKRFGGRIDLQYGQATETLQGSAANEPNPQVFRNLFQAYGSYLAPVGTGLQIDFGKFASSLGVEGNYTKDQINYSRSYLFNYLPFYHTGFRANYNVNAKVNVAYWLVNGAQQTDDFNGFKSQAFITTLKPAKTVTWNVNYYFGQEGHDSTAVVANGAQEPATPNGREHIFDTYATWTATPKLTLVGEADYVLNRVNSNSQPGRVAAGAFYARYQLPRSYALAGRAEYLDDRGGLFSGTTQALKEFTFTFEHQFEPGFLVRTEYRRDFSNQHYFLTATEGVLNTAQGTATLGLVYWWGTKQGSW